MLVPPDDEVAGEPCLFDTRCEAIAAAVENRWRGGSLRAVLVERDAEGRRPLDTGAAVRRAAECTRALPASDPPASPGAAGAGT